MRWIQKGLIVGVISVNEHLQADGEKAQLKSEVERLAKQLEDERQKVEDLMFRNEEENINKEDYHVRFHFIIYYYYY